MSAFGYIVDVLSGTEPAPPSNFISLCGKLSDEDLSSLCATLQYSRFSGGLRLQDCSISDAGAAKIAAALQCNESLQILEMQGTTVNMITSA